MNFVIRGWKIQRLPSKNLVEQFSISAHRDKITKILEVKFMIYKDE
jgi:hypothetical protein